MANDVHPPRTRSTAKGVGLFLLDLALYCVALSGALVLESVVPRFACALAAGLVAALLYLVAHDAIHGSLTGSRRLNRIIGIVADLPAWHAPNMWAHIHHREHHRYTNLAGDGHDHVWVPYSRAQYDALTPFGRWRERFYRSLPGVGACYFVEVVVKRQWFPPARQRAGANARGYRQDMLVLVPWLALSVGGPVWLSASGIIAQPWWSALLFAVVIPQLVSTWVSGLTVLLQHTHPDIRWYDDVDEWRRESRSPQNSARIVFSPLFNAIHHFAFEHGAHHVAPGVPIWGLGRVQRALDGSEDVAAWRFSFANCLKVLRHCRLYDYRRHRWLDFDGSPSTPVDLGPSPLDGGCARAPGATLPAG